MTNAEKYKQRVKDHKQDLRTELDKSLSQRTILKIKDGYLFADGSQIKESEVTKQ